jgi:hypothetical protein
MTICGVGALAGKGQRRPARGCHDAQALRRGPRRQRHCASQQEGDRLSYEERAKEQGERGEFQHGAEPAGMFSLERSRREALGVDGRFRSTSRR